MKFFPEALEKAREELISKSLSELRTIAVPCGLIASALVMVPWAGPLVVGALIGIATAMLVFMAPKALKAWDNYGVEIDALEDAIKFVNGREEISLEEVLDNPKTEVDREEIRDNGYTQIVTTHDTNCLYPPGSRNAWNMTKCEVYDDSGEYILTLRRNYSNWPFAFLNQAGKTYLLCGESYMAPTVVDLGTGEKATPVDDHWCWARMESNPTSDLVAVEGCYWGGPWSVRIWDFSDPMGKVTCVTESDEGDLSLSAEETSYVWVDGGVDITAVYDVFAPIGKPEFEYTSEDWDRDMQLMEEMTDEEYEENMISETRVFKWRFDGKA